MNRRRTGRRREGQGRTAPRTSAQARLLLFRVLSPTGLYPTLRVYHRKSFVWLGGVAEVVVEDVAEAMAKDVAEDVGGRCTRTQIKSTR